MNDGVSDGVRDGARTMERTNTYSAQFGAIGINMLSICYHISDLFNTTLSYFDVFLLILDLRAYLES